MLKPDLAELLRLNGHVDVAVVRDGLEIHQQMTNLGVPRAVYRLGPVLHPQANRRDQGSEAPLGVWMTCQNTQG